MSEELKAVLRDMGVAGYRAGYEASLSRPHSDPQSARVHFPDGAGREIRFVLEQVHGDGYMRGMHDHQRGFHEEAVWKDEGRVSRESILRVEPELRAALREIGAAGYDRGYGDAEAGRGKAPGWPRRSPPDRGPGDAAEYLQSDAAARVYVRGFDDHFRGASREDAGGWGWTTSKEVTSIGENDLAKLRYTPRGRSADPDRSPRAAAAVAADRETGPSR